MTEQTELQARIEQLAECRRREAEISGAIALYRAAWENEFAEVLAALDTAKDLTKNAELGVRELALAEYERTGNKSPHPAAKVRITKGVEYAADAALTWVRENMPGLLTLDKKRFDKAAKSGIIEWSGLTHHERATTAISRDLSEYIKDGE